MIKIKVLEIEEGAMYKKGDILFVRWAFCNQSGGKEYYHNDRFSWEIPNTHGFMFQDILLKNCKVLNWGSQKPKINSIRERAKKVPLHTKLYVDLLSYALNKKYLTHEDFENE